MGLGFLFWLAILAAIIAAVVWVLRSQQRGLVYWNGAQAVLRFWKSVTPAAKLIATSTSRRSAT